MVTPPPSLPLLAPSILGGELSNLSQSLNTIHKFPLEWVHLDIMDGHFVPNITFGPQAVKELRQNSSLFFDTHLMLSNPSAHIPAFIDAGANLITIHAELPESEIDQSFQLLKEANLPIGLSVTPNTPWERITPYAKDISLALIMSVEPGFGGQSFAPDTPDKMTALDAFRKANNHPFLIEVDGGINAQTGKACLNAGADILVAGSAFFNANSREDLLKLLP